MIIPIASDHAGFAAKAVVKTLLEAMGHEPVDYGTHSEASVDYADFAVPLAQAVARKEYDHGILICGSGQGMCMTANKIPDVRAALVWAPDIARLAVQHNHANVICLPGRYLTEDDFRGILSSWLGAEFEGGRHATRIQKLHDLTQL
jgi:ribose 5-phosphate isomerase B